MIEGINIYKKYCLINWWARKTVTSCCGSHSFSQLKYLMTPNPDSITDTTQAGLQ